MIAIQELLDELADKELESEVLICGQPMKIKTSNILKPGEFLLVSGNCAVKAINIGKKKEKENESGEQSQTIANQSQTIEREK